MNAAVINEPGSAPVFRCFRKPQASNYEEVITMRAAALSQFSKSRSSGSHYSSSGTFPMVAGAEGVGRTAEGRRVYFVLPEAPFGALAEFSLVRASHCVEIPDALDDLSAAAIANPGMSAWAALVERARLHSGETVLVNGATGSAGRLAVQLAKHLGASKVIATGRNEAELNEILSIGADRVIPFRLDPASDIDGPKQYEQALRRELTGGIDVVLDYLWGESAKTVIVAIAKSVEDATPVRFIHVGGASLTEEIGLPGAALRSSAIQLMGSGIKSVAFSKLLGSIASVFEAAAPARLEIAKRVVPLSETGKNWNSPGKPRVVVAIE